MSVPDEVMKLKDGKIIVDKLKSMVAVQFVQATANDAGTYVVYQGQVYYLPDGHTANTTWENTTKVGPTNIGDELSGVKTAIQGVSEKLAISNNELLKFRNGNVNAQGVESYSDNRLCTDYLFCPEGFAISPQSGFKTYLRYFSSNTADSIVGGSGSWETGDIDRKPNNTKYIRVIYAKIDDTNLTAADITSPLYIVLRTNTDLSLNKQNAPADAKITGEEMLKLKETAKLPGTNIAPYNIFTAYDDTKVLPVINDDDESITITSISANWYNCVSTNLLWARGKLIPGKTYRLHVKAEVVVGTPYMRVTIRGNKTNPDAIVESIMFNTDGDKYLDFVATRYMNYISLFVSYESSKLNQAVKYSEIWLKEYTTSVDTTPESWGVANALARAKHITDIKWTPKGNIPNSTGGYYALSEQKGLPYSSVRDQDKAISLDVSFRTFMTAVNDPRSVLYTRKSTVSNATTYYGTVCSGLVNYSLGIELDLTNYFLGEWDGFETIPMIDVKPGDMLFITGHVAFIKNTIKDTYGRTAAVEVVEEWPPLPKDRIFTWSQFISEYAGYIARRYKKLNGIDYTAIPYVQNFDEEPSEITYPDIQTEFGDGAVFMKGEDVVVHVLNSTGYTSIDVKIGTTTVYTSNNVADFTLENVQAGLHTITMHGETDSVSTFFVVDATASFDTSTGEVTFSSTNATPVLVNVYNLPVDRNIVCKPIILTDADRIAGSINVLQYMDQNYQYAKVTFKTAYGTAVWYSETHQKWTPIGS